MNKSSFRKLATLMLAAVMLISISSTALAELPKEEWPEVEFSFWELGDVYSFMDENDDALADAIEAGGQINLVNRPITIADYSEKILLWAATDDLPNVWIFDGTGQRVIWDWVEQGLIRSIPEDLSDYPYLNALLYGNPTPFFEKAKKDGVYWAIPRADFVEPVTYTHGATFMRKSDYEALGSPELPVTLDEWYDFCALIKETWPDRVVMSGPHVDNFFSQINPDEDLGSYYYVEDKDVWIPAFFARYERYKAFNRFWNAGFIDRDYINALDYQTLYDRFVSGGAVLLPQDPLPSHISNDLNPYWVAKNPGVAFGDAMIMIMPPTGTDATGYVMPNKYWSENYISAKTTDEQLAAILRLYDFFLSPEGMNLRRYGIEGKDFHYDADGNVVITRDTHESGEFKALMEVYPSGYFARCWATWDEEFPFVDPSIDEGIRAFGQQYLEAKQDFDEYPECYNIELGFITTEAKSEFVINSGDEDSTLLIIAEDYDAAWNAMMEKYENLGLWEMSEEVTNIGRETGIID